MPYDRDTPLTINETFSVSQPKIKSNFIAIDEFVSVDHEGFADPAGDQGRHIQVRFLERDNDISTNVDEMALYTLDIGTQPNLYLRLEGDGSIFNMTPSTAGHGENGWEILPSGLTLIWGTCLDIQHNTTVNFPADGFGNNGVCYQVLITRVAADDQARIVHVVDSLPASFRASAYGHNGVISSSEISYLAIGKYVT